MSKLKKEFEQYTKEFDMSSSEKIGECFGKYRKCLIVGCVLSILNQGVGTNTVMYYSPEIIIDSGTSIDQ